MPVSVNETDPTIIVQVIQDATKVVEVTQPSDIQVTVKPPVDTQVVNVSQPPDTIVTVKPPGETKVIEVQPATLQGQKGDSPDRSIYSKREYEVTNPTLVIDASQATTFFLKLKVSITSLTIINWPNDGKTQRVALYFKQDEVGNRQVLSWPPNTLWSFGNRPILTRRANAIDCFVLDTFDSGQTIFAGIVGLDYA